MEIVETLRILDTMHTEKLITRQEYDKAIRRPFRNYWNQRSSVDLKLSGEIKNSFSRQRVSGSSYTLMIFSLYWHNLFHKSK